MFSENHFNPASSQSIDSSQSVNRALLPAETSSLSKAQLEKLSIHGKTVARKIERLFLILTFAGTESKKNFYITKGYHHIKHATPDFIQNNFPRDTTSKHLPQRAHSFTLSEAEYLNRIFQPTFQEKMNKSAFKEKLHAALEKSEGRGREALSLLDKVDLILKVEEKLDTDQGLKDLDAESLKTAKQLILKSVLKINLNQFSKIDKDALLSAIVQTERGLTGKALSRYEKICENPQAYEKKINDKDVSKIADEITKIGPKFKLLYTFQHLTLKVDEWNEFNDLSIRGKIEDLSGDELLNSMSQKIKNRFLEQMEMIYNETGEDDEALASALTKYIRCHRFLHKHENDPHFHGDKQHLFLLQLPFKKGITIDFDENLTKLYDSYKAKGAELIQSLKAKFEIKNSDIPQENEVHSKNQRVYQFLKEGYSDYNEYAQQMYQSLQKGLASKERDALLIQLTQYENLEGYEQAAEALKKVIDETEIPQRFLQQGVNKAAQEIQQAIGVVKENLMIKKISKDLKNFGRNLVKGKFSFKTKKQPLIQPTENLETHKSKKNHSFVYNKTLPTSNIYSSYAPMKLEGQIKTATDLSKFVKDLKNPEVGLKFIQGLCQAYSGQGLSDEQVTALSEHKDVLTLPQLPEKITAKLEVISPALNLLKKNHEEIVNLISALISSVADEAELARLNPTDKTNLFINLFESVIDKRKQKVLEKVAEEEKAIQATISAKEAAAESTKNKPSNRSRTESTATDSTVEMSFDSSFSNDDVGGESLTQKRSEKGVADVSEIESDKTDISKSKSSPKLFKLPKVMRNNLGVKKLLGNVILNYFPNFVTSIILNYVIAPKLYPSPDLPSVKDVKALHTMYKKDPNNNEIVSNLYSFLPQFNEWLKKQGKDIINVTGDASEDFEILTTAATQVEEELKAQRKSLAAALTPLIQPIFNKFLKTHKTKDIFNFITPILTKLSQVDVDDVKKQQELYSAIASFCIFVLDEAYKEKELIENIFSLLEKMSQKPVEEKNKQHL